MKLTREQVSQLSDVELNLAMYDHYWVVNSGEPFDEFFNSVRADKLDYLTDYNLTMPLAHKLNFIIDLAGEYPDDGSICWSQFKEYTADNENPLRAICEVLIMIALEKQT